MPLAARPPRNFTSGTIARWRKVSGLVLAEVTFEPGQRIHHESHAHARFVLILGGSISEVRGADEDAPYGPSTLLFRCANEVRSYVAGERGARCLVVDMADPWIGRAREQARLLTRSHAFRRGLLLHLAHRLYGEFRQRDEVSRLAIESLALGVLAEASRRSEETVTCSPLWLQVAIALVEERFHEPLPLAGVARQVGVHPVHLARTFRRVYQTTFGSYVRQVRLDFARSQLVGPAPLSDIAFAAGFCDQSHFSRCFKRHTGLTPAEYRARLR